MSGNGEAAPLSGGESRPEHSDLRKSEGNRWDVWCYDTGDRDDFGDGRGVQKN